MRGEWMQKICLFLSCTPVSSILFSSVPHARSRYLQTREATDSDKRNSHHANTSHETAHLSPCTVCRNRISGVSTTSSHYSFLSFPYHYSYLIQMSSSAGDPPSQTTQPEELPPEELACCAVCNDGEWIEGVDCLEER